MESENRKREKKSLIRSSVSKVLSKLQLREEYHEFYINRMKETHFDVEEFIPCLRGDTVYTFFGDCLPPPSLLHRRFHSYFIFVSLESENVTREGIKQFETARLETFFNFLKGISSLFHLNLQRSGHHRYYECVVCAVEYNWYDSLQNLHYYFNKFFAPVYETAIVLMSV